MAEEISLETYKKAYREMMAEEEKKKFSSSSGSVRAD